MRAILAVPETKRFGLTGKPALTQTGITGSMQASFNGGQKVNITNLRSIAGKIAEANQALASAHVNIDKSSETIDNIQEGTEELSKLLNDYWSRWDKRSIADEFSQVQFLSTAVNLDKVRHSMLGETVDPYPLNFTLPRGMPWDSCLRWETHKLSDEPKWDSFLDLTLNLIHSVKVGNYSTYIGFDEYENEVNQLIDLCEITVAEIAASLAMQVIFIPTSKALVAAIDAMPSHAPMTAGELASTLWVMQVTYEPTGDDIGYSQYLVKYLAVFTALAGALKAIPELVRNFRVTELRGYNARNNFFEGIVTNWSANILIFGPTFLSFSTLLKALLTSVATLCGTSATTTAASLSSALTMLVLLNTAFDVIVPPGVPTPNQFYVGAIGSWGTSSTFVYRSTRLVNKVANEALVVFEKYNLSYYAPIVLLLGLESTRVNETKGNPKSWSNQTQQPPFADTTKDLIKSLKSSTSQDDLFYCNSGYLTQVTMGDTFDKVVATMLQTASILNIGEVAFDYLFQGDSHTWGNPGCGSVYSGGSTMVFLRGTGKNKYPDIWGQEIPLVTSALLQSVQGYKGGNQQTFYGPCSRVGSASLDSSVSIAHTYNGNIFNIRSNQVGGTINRTIVIRTKVNCERGIIFYAFTVLCTFTGSDNIHFLLERSCIKYPQATGAEFSHLEQIIYNFDPENYGTLFTNNKNGKLFEIFGFTADGHEVAYLPNVRYKDNYLLGQFVNREVTGYNRYTDWGLQSSGANNGSIDSYVKP